MSGGKRGCTDDIDAGLERQHHRLFRRLEQRAGHDIEAHVAKGRGDHVRAAIMPVLAHLGDEQLGFAPQTALDRLDAIDHLRPAAVVLVGRGVDALDRGRARCIAAEHVLHRLADLAQGRAGACSLDREFEQIALALGAFAQGIERGLARSLVARGLDRVNPRNLAFAHLRIVDLERFEQVFIGEAIFVHPDDHVIAAVDTCLATGGGLLDHRLGPARRDRLGHAAFALDALDDLPGLVDQFLGQALDIIAAAQRIDDLGHPGFFLDDDLRVAGDARREIGGQCDRLVERIGVQRLRATQHRGHRLDGCADDVVIRVLLGQRHAAGLAVGAQHLRALVLRAEPGHHPVPQHARGAQLGDFHEEVHADGEEERQPPGELVDVEARGDAVFHIFHAVGDGEGELLHLRRTGFLHVIAGDRDAVELGHLAAGIAENVRDDPHRGLRWVDVRIADHELLEDVVLDGPIEQLALDPLLLARDDEEGEDRDHRAVHGHADRHLVERNAVEQDLHVLDRVDSHARLADIAGDARMIAVIAAVGGEVERDR